MLEFRRLGRNYAKNMKRMFSAVSNLYASYWSDFFHFAIFEDGESFEEALKKLMKDIFQKCTFKTHQKFWI